MLKTGFTLLFIILFAKLEAQKIESIYVNLYTDSLKKGTYNYINVDGKLSNGRFIPLDSNSIKLHCAAAKFIGNSLLLPMDFKDTFVTIFIKVTQNPALNKEFVMWVKQMEDPPLKSINEIENEVKVVKKKSKKRKN